LTVRFWCFSGRQGDTPARGSPATRFSPSVSPVQGMGVGAQSQDKFRRTDHSPTLKRSGRSPPSSIFHCIPPHLSSSLYKLTDERASPYRQGGQARATLPSLRQEAEQEDFQPFFLYPVLLCQCWVNAGPSLLSPKVPSPMEFLRGVSQPHRHTLKHPVK
jgi:hypothetical protein